MEKKFRNELNANIKLSNLYKVGLCQKFDALLFTTKEFTPIDEFQPIKNHLEYSSLPNKFLHLWFDEIFNGQITFCFYLFEHLKSPFMYVKTVM